MLFHNSKPMEHFAEKAHWVWAWVSLSQALLAGGSFWLLYFPATHVLGWLGNYLFGLLLVCGAQIIFGFGGVIFHVLGAQDHRENLKTLGRKK